MKKTTILSTMILFFISFNSLADTIHVPGDQPSIQAGIHAAVAGDTVLVAPGMYLENLDFLGKAISVISSHGPEQTIIDGNNNGSVVMFYKGEGSDSLLSGFTLTHGNGSTVYIMGNPYNCGGGILCYKTSPIIRGNLIVENMVADVGGGICSIVNGHPVIEDNTVIYNVAEVGGGIACSDTDPTITKNRIGYNQAEGQWARGGGIFVSSFTDVMIYGNTIYENDSDWQGGGISTDGNTWVESTLLSRNSAAEGGGVYVGMFEPVFTGCTFYGNTASGQGGGIATERFSTSMNTVPWVQNSILWGNEAILGPQISIGTRCTEPGELNITYSDLQGGKAWVYRETGCVIFYGPGMIETDPLFVDESGGDFHLIYPSPCRNAGDNTLAGTYSMDFEGDLRLFEGTVDMGADEFHNRLYCTGDFSPNGSIEGKLIGIPETLPVGLFIGSGIMDPPLQHKWGEFYLASPWMLFPSASIPADGVLKIPATLPHTPAPYDIPMQALIGWELSNLFVLEVR